MVLLTRGGREPLSIVDRDECVEGGSSVLARTDLDVCMQHVVLLCKSSDTIHEI